MSQNGTIACVEACASESEPCVSSAASMGRKNASSSSSSSSSPSVNEKPATSAVACRYVLRRYVVSFSSEPGDGCIANSGWRSKNGSATCFQCSTVMDGSSASSSSANMRSAHDVPSSSASSSAVQPSGECVARREGSAFKYAFTLDASPRAISAITASTSASRSSRGAVSPPKKSRSASAATELSAVRMASSGTSTTTSPTCRSRVATQPRPVFGNRPMVTPESRTPADRSQLRYASSEGEWSVARSSAAAAAVLCLFVSLSLLRASLSDPLDAPRGAFEDEALRFSPAAMSARAEDGVPVERTRRSRASRCGVSVRSRAKRTEREDKSETACFAKYCKKKNRSFTTPPRSRRWPPPPPPRLGQPSSGPPAAPASRAPPAASGGKPAWCTRA